MFSMGLTLKPTDFRRILGRPGVIGLGIVLQYGVMPLGALLIGHAFALPADLVAGMVLVGCSPGGTASNVMCYLAKADVALSVSLTMMSTLLAVVMTPYLTWMLIGQSVPVDIWGMLQSMIRIVLIPVILGIAINTCFERYVERVRFALPAVATAAILIVVAIVVSLNHEQIATAGFAILAAVVVHNCLGLGTGYLVPHLLGFDSRTCRTLAIETGMQNSGLGVALALNYFSAAAALPGAIFSVWHNISGSLLAGHWRNAGTQNSQEVLSQ
jgi:BASS family bile acid:Na+ symporter